METTKETVIRLRVTKELKERFQAICKAKAINSSELLRQMITQWCYEQQDTNNPHNRGTDL